jgi:DinB superfamily
MTLPKLAAPGAGLPPVELWFAKLFFRLFRSNAKRRTLISKLESEGRLIRDLVHRGSEQSRQLPILIPRVMGIEDSSRNWSIDMTLEHLVLTTNAMQDFAKRLSEGETDLTEVSIAAVKPPDEVAAEVYERFEACRALLIATIRGWSHFSSEPKHSHPWFGPLSAWGWLCLATIHIGIHRRQMAFIRALEPRR